MMCESSIAPSTAQDRLVLSSSVAKMLAELGLIPRHRQSDTTLRASRSLPAQQCHRWHSEGFAMPAPRFPPRWSVEERAAEARLHAT